MTLINQLFFHPGCGQIVEAHRLTAYVMHPVPVGNAVYGINIRLVDSFVAVHEGKMIAADPVLRKKSEARCRQKLGKRDNRRFMKGQRQG